MIPFRIRGGNQLRTVEGVRRLFSSALDRFHHSIRDVDLSLADVNGPKGGEDKVCRAQIRLYPRGVLVVRGTGTSLSEAAGTACEKLRYVLQKTLERRKFDRRRRKRLMHAVGDSV